MMTRQSKSAAEMEMDGERKALIELGAQGNHLGKVWKERGAGSEQGGLGNFEFLIVFTLTCSFSTRRLEA